MPKTRTLDAGPLPLLAVALALVMAALGVAMLLPLPAHDRAAQTLQATEDLRTRLAAATPADNASDTAADRSRPQPAGGNSRRPG